MDTLLAAAIFLVTYALVASDRVDRTAVALLGGLAMVGLRIIDQDAAFAAIDLNVIFLLAGMMILAGILRRTGFFQLVAIRAVKIAVGDPMRLLIVLGLVTALLSAFLDNVTTVVLVAPVTLYIAKSLRVSPVPFLVSEVLASNIGGAATLIGDPPNILIGSASGFGFVDFLVTLGPPVVLILLASAVIVRFVFAPDLEVHAEARERVLALDEGEVITDPRLLRISLAVIGATLVGFLFQQPLGLGSATIALLGATVLILLARVDPVDVFAEIEWPTLFFFVGLFMLVGGVVRVGLVASAADLLLRLTGQDQAVATIGLLWLSGIASGVIDNIPYTTAMIPVVERLGQDGLRTEPLWWSLALGASLGGNATLVGASANIVVANLAARAGHPIGFGTFLRYGILVVACSLAISSLYLWLRFLA